MKSALTIILLALLGFGEYVFVEVMPLPEHKRMGKLVEITHAEPLFYFWTLRRLESAAKEGNPYAYAGLLDMGRIRQNDELVGRALGLLESSNSFVAKRHLYVDQYFQNSKEFRKNNSLFTPIFLALSFMSYEENHTIPFLPKERQVEFQQSAKEGVAEFHEQVEIGNPKYVKAARLVEQYRTRS